jgi:hypothetical protein
MKKAHISIVLGLVWGLALLGVGTTLMSSDVVSPLSGEECKALYAGQRCGNSHYCDYSTYCNDGSTDCDDWTIDGQATCITKYEYVNLGGRKSWFCTQDAAYGTCDASNYNVCKKKYKCNWSGTTGCYRPSTSVAEYKKYVECTDDDGTHT